MPCFSITFKPQNIFSRDINLTHIWDLLCLHSPVPTFFESFPICILGWRGQETIHFIGRVPNLRASEDLQPSQNCLHTVLQKGSRWESSLGILRVLWGGLDALVSLPHAQSLEPFRKYTTISQFCIYAHIPGSSSHYFRLPRIGSDGKWGFTRTQSHAFSSLAACPLWPVGD